MSTPSYDLGARIKVRITGGGRTLERLCGADPSPYFSGEDNGFYYVRYEVPEDVDRVARLVVEVVDAAKPGLYGALGGNWFVLFAPVP